MSLVNDALKRAKETHDRQGGQPMRGAPLHTASAPPASKMWVVALLAFVLALAAAVAGIKYWQKHQSLPFFKTHTEETTKPTYKIIIGENPDAKPKPAPAAPAARVPVKITTVEPTTPAPKVETVLAPVPAAPPAPISPPIALKLQGILYSATKPAAILNGRTIFVGDVVGGMTISSIESDRITITYSNQPIVLRMP